MWRGVNCDRALIQILCVRERVCACGCVGVGVYTAVTCDRAVLRATILERGKTDSKKSFLLESRLPPSRRVQYPYCVQPVAYLQRTR